MEMKLTAAIAAMYWGCGIVCTYMNNQLFKRVYKFSEDGICDLIGDGDIIYRSRVISECKLILKPLNEITDDDAVEVAKILYNTHGQEVTGVINIIQRFEEGIELQADDTEISVIITNNVGFSFFNNAVIVVQGDSLDAAIPCVCQVPTINYLRSKSYDCDNLIPNGIAITKQNTQNEN